MLSPGINSHTGCSWPYEGHIIGRDHLCVDDVYARTNPIISPGEDAEFTITMNGKN